MIAGRSVPAALRLLRRCWRTLASSPVVSRRQPGQAIIEFAFIVTTLTVMALGVFELGRGLHTYLSVIHCARDGARLGMDSAATDGQIIDTVKAAAPSLNFVNDARNSIIVTRSAGQLSVAVIYNLDVPIPLLSQTWGGGPLVIRHTGVSRVV